MTATRTSTERIALGPVNAYPDAYKNKDFFSLYSKNYASPHISHLYRFARPHENAKTIDIR